jgi:hypothetical protein
VALATIQQANQALAARLDAQQITISAGLVCPLTQEIMMDPVVAADGHTYERRALEIWLTCRPCSPLTHMLLPNTEWPTNWVVKSLLHRLREERPRSPSSSSST